MKQTALALAAAMTLFASLAPSMGEAKSVKWSCVAPDPLMPWYMVCTGSTSRP